MAHHTISIPQGAPWMKIGYIPLLWGGEGNTACFHKPAFAVIIRIVNKTFWSYVKVGY